MSFEYPLAFCIILMYFVCQKYFKPKYFGFYFPHVDLLRQISMKENRLLELLKFLIILLLSISLASPIKEDKIDFINNKGYEISLILDASASMNENNKFNIVKDIIKDFILKRQNDKLALSIFADFAYVAIPLTYDKKSIARLLSNIHVGVAGRQTALNEALFLSSNIFKNSQSKNKIAILLTDGMNNINNIPLEVAIDMSKKYGIKVYTIGVGNIGDFDPNTLEQIASKTSGKFYHTNTIKGLEQIYSTINALEKSEIKADKYSQKYYYFAYPLALAVLFIFVLFYLNNKENA